MFFGSAVEMQSIVRGALLLTFLTAVGALSRCQMRCYKESFFANPFLSVLQHSSLGYSCLHVFRMRGKSQPRGSFFLVRCRLSVDGWRPSGTV